MEANLIIRSTKDVEAFWIKQQRTLSHMCVSVMCFKRLKLCVHCPLFLSSSSSFQESVSGTFEFQSFQWYAQINRIMSNPFLEEKKNLFWKKKTHFFGCVCLLLLMAAAMKRRNLFFRACVFLPFFFLLLACQKLIEAGKNYIVGFVVFGLFDGFHEF